MFPFPLYDLHYKRWEIRYEKWEQLVVESETPSKGDHFCGEGLEVVGLVLLTPVRI